MTGRVDFSTMTADHLHANGSLKWSNPETIGLWIAEMDFGLADVVAKQLRTIVDRALTGYPTPAVIADVEAAYRAFAAERYGWDLEGAVVKSSPDVLTSLQFVLDFLIPTGSPVVVPTPAYMPFLTIPESRGHEVIQVRMTYEDGGWVYDLDALDEALKGAGLLLLCNPHNPIGRVLEPAEMLRISEVVERHGVRVFVDEIHAPLIFPGHQHVPFASLNETTARQAFTATSASKGFNFPGLKASQVILTNPDDIAMWQRAGGPIEHETSFVGLLATLAAYREGGPWLDEVLAYMNETRQWFPGALADALPGATTTVPEGTYLALVDFRGVDGADRWGDHPAPWFTEHAKVQMVDGVACGEQARGLTRVNLATTREILAEALDRMASAVARRQENRPHHVARPHH